MYVHQITHKDTPSSCMCIPVLVSCHSKERHPPPPQHCPTSATAPADGAPHHLTPAVLLQVALKRIGDVLNSPDNARKVLREVCILRRLSHPHIISLIDVFYKPAATGALPASASLVVASCHESCGLDMPCSISLMPEAVLLSTRPGCRPP
jgi:serine/threonine protein kinase